MWWKTIISWMTLWFIAPAATGTDSFQLKNTHPRRATFNFYSNNAGYWEEDEATISHGGQAWFNLNGGDTYVLYLYVENQAYGEQTGSFRIKDLLSGRPNQKITLSEIMVQEARTKTVEVIVNTPEERTRTYTVTKMVPETRTRTVQVRGPDGQLRQEERTYTVMVPVQEEKTATYTVMVPHTIQKQVNYVERVPKVALTAGTGVNQEQVIISQMTVDSKDSPLPVDPRERYLGITLRDTAEGPLVTQVAENSPAKKLRKVGANDGKIYGPAAGRTVIVEVNGIRVRTSEELIREIQRSPPSVILTMKSLGHRVAHRYRTRLEMR